MHSNKNSSPHPKSASDVNLTNPKGKSTVASQTENFPNYGKLCNLGEMSLQEIKDQYEKTLNFLNDCHEYMNQIFSGRFNANNSRPFGFHVPEVTNYFSLLEMYLERNKVENIGRVQEVRANIKRDSVKEQLCFFDLRVVPDKGDGNGHNNVQKKEINLKTLSNAFEEIYKTCNNFESKSEVILNTRPRHKPSMKFKPLQEKPTFNPEQGDQAVQQNSIDIDLLDETLMEPHLSFTESIGSFTESNRSLSEFIDSESFSNSDQQGSSLLDNLNVGPRSEASSREVIEDEDVHSICDENYYKMGSRRSSMASVKKLKKSYPFTLSNRDMCREDIQEIISAMGLYTATGDIRPNIIELLDQETCKPPSNPSENSVKFRTKRQLEIKVHYNNQNMKVSSEEEIVVPSEPSEENLMADLCVTRSSSSSTIKSDSEVINIPNNKNNNIK